MTGMYLQFMEFVLLYVVHGAAEHLRDKLSSYLTVNHSGRMRDHYKNRNSITYGSTQQEGYQCCN